MNIQTALVRAFSLICLLVATPVLFAQKDSISDVFNNRELLYNNLYKEISARDLNLSDKISTSYFTINQTGYSASKLNKEIEQMATADWLTEQGKFSLYSRVKKMMANYEALANEKNSRYREAILTSTKLKDIELKPLSVVGDKLTFKEQFGVKLLLQSDRSGEQELNVTLSRYYVADLKSGIVKQLQPSLNNNMQLQVKRVLLPFVTSVYDKLATKGRSRHWPREFGIEEADTDADTDTAKKIVEENALIKTGKNLENVDLNEADFYWFGWGLMVSFPMYSAATEKLDGEGFAVFLPLDKCRSVLQFLPAYSFIGGYQVPPNNFTNFDYFDLTDRFYGFRSEPAVTQLFYYNKASVKPKTLTVIANQVMANQQKYFQGKFVYEFSYNDDLTKYSSRRKDYGYYYTNESGKLTKNDNKEARTAQESMYDEKGNLIYRNTGNASEINGFYFFYNRNNAYFFNLESSEVNRETKLTGIDLSNNRLCFPDVCFTLDGEMNPIGVKPRRTYQDDVQIARDSKGRVTEAHMENDRYNYYYEYDSNDRLVRYTTYEYTSLQKEVRFFYKENDLLPYYQTKHTFSGGQDTFQEENYEWVYY